MSKTTVKKLETRAATLEAQLKEALALAQRSRDEAGRVVAVAENRAARAEAEVAKATETVAELKERLHDAETNVAELRGYIGRVQEEDDNASEMVPTEMPSPLVELKSRVARAGFLRAHRSFGVDAHGSAAAPMGRDTENAPLTFTRRRHWTSL